MVPRDVRRPCFGNPAIFRARRSRAGDGCSGEHARDLVRGRRRICCRRRNFSRLIFRDHGSASTLWRGKCECVRVNECRSNCMSACCFILFYCILFILFVHSHTYCTLLYTTLFYSILYQLFIRLFTFGTLLYFILYYFILSNACYSAYLLYCILSLFLYYIMLHLLYILRFVLSCYALFYLLCIARYITLLYAVSYDCYCRTCVHVGE